MKNFYNILIIFTLISSCGDMDQKKYSQLEDLRVLAIEADFSEINTAQDVIVTPYISYPIGGDTTLDISYKACLNPGIEFGAEVSCDSYPASQVISGASTYTTSTIGAANFYTGQINPITLSIPASAFAFLASLDSKTQFNGYDFIMILTISDQNNSTQTITSLKRISLTTRVTADLNANPSISGAIQNNGIDLTTMPTSIANLTIDGLSAAESYQSETNTGTTNFTEQMLVSWFSNVGEFQFSRSDRDQSLEFDPQGATAGVIIGVYRDNRGGVKIIRLVL
jgi:hypothetical protein